MDKKRAYCCLNCTNSANCCGACGECPACCADCGDTSTCKGSAFLGKDNNFYLKWRGRNSSQNSTRYFYFDDAICIDHSVIVTSNSNSSFNSNGECQIIYFDNTTYSRECCECDCSQNPGGLQITNVGDQISRTTTSVAGAPTDGSGCESDPGYNATEPGPGYSCPGPSEQNETVNTENTICEYPEEESADQECTTTTINSRLIATVTWSSQLNLYDGRGDIVANPWSILPSPNPYNPLDPIRVVSAPACHFFAP